MGPFRKRARAPENLAKLSNDEHARHRPQRMGGLNPNSMMMRLGAPHHPETARLVEAALEYRSVTALRQ
jgi:hypothetical protein